MNPAPVLSDCMDWSPAGTGQKTMVNSNTWGSIPYSWPTGIAPTADRIESQYYIFWMQNMPGYQNGVRYGTNVMANWWQFTADWDNAINSNRGLYLAPKVSFLPGTMSHSNGVFRAMLSGDAGQSYTVESSSNLNTWSAAGSVTNFSGTWQFAATNSSPQQFFRVRQL
jgi:hypothetical protein